MRVTYNPSDIAPTVAYFDTEARLDVPDVLRQISWYKSQGMVKPEVEHEVDRPALCRAAAGQIVFGLVTITD